MSKLTDDKKLILVNIPGSHDSAAFNINFFGSVFAQTQSLDIEEQLKIGVRKLDIRMRKKDCKFSCGINKIEEDLDLDIICCHGICDCYQYDKNNNTKTNLAFKNVLLTIKNFLIDHPKESIILNFKAERGNKIDVLKRAGEIFLKVMNGYYIEFNKNLTLGDIRGKVVVDYSFNNGEINLIDFTHFGINDIHKQFVSEFFYSEFKVNWSIKIEEVKKFLMENEIKFENAEKDFEKNEQKYPYIYSISCTGEFENIVPLPKKQADYVNSFIVNYNLKKGFYIGWVNIDFVDINITKKIIDTNFQ